MSQICEISLCNRASRVVCDCCQQNVCIGHLNEHNDILNGHLISFIDALSRFQKHLQGLNIQQIINSYRQDLEQWRIDTFTKINQYFEERTQNLERFILEKIDEQQDEVNQLQLKITDMVNNQRVSYQDITLLTSMIEQLQTEINNIHTKYLDIHLQPVNVDPNWINIRGYHENEYDLLSLSSVYKMINRPDGSYAAIASSEKHLLIHQMPNLCLVDRNLEILKRTPWRYGTIYNICWSTKLQKFIILTDKNLFLIDEDQMLIEKLKLTEKRKWLSCTCSDDFLFLSSNHWGSLITKVDLNQSKLLLKKWESPPLCKKDEYIDDITYNDGKIAMIIRNHSNRSIRLELRTADKLNQLWSLSIDAKWNPSSPYTCSKFLNNDWIISDFESGRLINVTKTGRIKAVIPYNTIPYSLTTFTSNIFAVSTKEGINFHFLNHRKTYTISLV